MQGKRGLCLDGASIVWGDGQQTEIAASNMVASVMRLGGKKQIKRDYLQTLGLKNLCPGWHLRRDFLDKKTVLKLNELEAFH